MCMDHYTAPLPQGSVIFFDEPPTPTVVVEEDRGRSLRSSRAPTIVEAPPLPCRLESCSRSSSPCRCYRRPPSPSFRRRRSRSYSPMPPRIINIPSPSSPPPITFIPPEPTPFVPPPSWYAAPSSCIWPTEVMKVPTVDILTFKYKENMAYAPAAKTYDEAINNVLELWPELRDVDRDQIRLLVSGSDHLVRVPKMTWSAVLCDVPRYEVVHVQVEQVPPPPQYQGKGKGKWGGDDEKGRRSGGLFSSIKRIFG